MRLAEQIVGLRPVRESCWPAFRFLPGPREKPAGLRPAARPTPGLIDRARARIRAGQTSCIALVEEALGAIAARNGELNAFVEVLEAGALAEAAARDAEVTHGHLRGPLHGIPLSVKDVIHVAGVPTRAGSEAYWQVPGRDASAVTRLREAGAVIIGKTTTHEFALGLTTPQSRNPHDPARVPGGSSGGSAIAVATGMGLGSIGTDTRASIRIPAALSGVVGFKATFGKVPADGLVQLSWTLDHVGPIASTVADAALLLDVLEGISFSRTVGAEPSSLRVGVPPDGCSGADPE
ncbi:MAG: amidase, partial [Acidimicrobiales bacterium]